MHTAYLVLLAVAELERVGTLDVHGGAGEREVLAGLVLAPLYRDAGLVQGDEEVSEPLHLVRQVRDLLAGVYRLQELLRVYQGDAAEGQAVRGLLVVELVVGHVEAEGTRGGGHVHQEESVAQVGAGVGESVVLS